MQRSAALAAGALNAAATTVDQHIVWTSAGIPTVQVALIDKSNGGDGKPTARQCCSSRMTSTRRSSWIELPHPRHYKMKTSPQFSDYKARLTEEIRVEAMKAAEMV